MSAAQPGLAGRSWLAISISTTAEVAPCRLERLPSAGWAGLGWLGLARRARLIRLSLGKTDFNGVQPTLITLRMAGTAKGVVGQNPGVAFARQRKRCYGSGGRPCWRMWGAVEQGDEADEARSTSELRSLSPVFDGRCGGKEAARRYETAVLRHAPAECSSP